MFAELSDMMARFLVDERMIQLGITVSQIFLIILAAHLAIRLLYSGIARIFERDDKELLLMGEQRAKTLAGLLKSSVRYGIDLIAVLAVLDKLGVPTGTLLASVGLASLAIGFGAQSLVQDVIAGFFILYENHFDIGDYVETSGVDGIVEEMGLRSTKIRDFGGQLHILPNGAIAPVTNYSRGNMRVLVDVDIPYETPIDDAVTAIEGALAEAPAHIPDLIEGPRVLGVNDFGPRGYSIRIWGQAKAMTQWDATRRLRRLVAEGMAKNGIPIAYPTYTLASDPLGEGVPSKEAASEPSADPSPGPSPRSDPPA